MLLVVLLHRSDPEVEAPSEPRPLVHPSLRAAPEPLPAGSGSASSASTNSSAVHSSPPGRLRGYPRVRWDEVALPTRPRRTIGTLSLRFA